MLWRKKVSAVDIDIDILAGGPSCPRTYCDASSREAAEFGPLFRIARIGDLKHVRGCGWFDLDLDLS